MEKRKGGAGGGLLGGLIDEEGVSGDVSSAWQAFRKVELLRRFAASLRRKVLFPSWQCVKSVACSLF